MRHSISFSDSLLRGSLLALAVTVSLPLSAQTRPVLASHNVKASKSSAKKHKVSPAAQMFTTLQTALKRAGAGSEEEREEREPGKANKPKNRKAAALHEAMDAYQARLFYFQQRAVPFGYIDTNALRSAQAYRERMPAANPALLHPNAHAQGIHILGSNPLPGPIDQPFWEYIGPTNFQAGTQFGGGPDAVSGRVNAITFDPRNPRTVYIATPRGGIWKTVDAGVHWKPLTDNQAGLSFSSIVVDPSNSNILYAGSGDYDGMGLDGLGVGLLKSIDGGKTWRRLGAALFGKHAIRTILIDPANPQTLLLGTGTDKNLFDFDFQTNINGGIYRSTDGGTTWTQVLAPSTDADPAPPSVGGFVSRILYNADRSAIYAAVDWVGVYKSVDNGLTWNKILQIDPITDPVELITHFTLYRLDVAPSLIDPKVVYVVSDARKEVFRSKDGGNVWINATSNLPTDDFTWFQVFYDFYMTASKATYIDRRGPKPVTKTKDIMYLGMLGLFQSEDNGKSWQDASLTYTGNDLTHTDQHAIAINPLNPNDTLVGNDGGVYRLTYNPEYKPPFAERFHFKGLNQNLAITELYGAAYHPSDPTKMIVGAQDNSTPRANGDLTQWDNVGVGDGAYCAINPLNPLTEYDCAPGLTVFRTDDNWLNATDISPNTGTENVAFIAPLIIDNSNPNFLYGGTQFVYRYDHDKKTWTKGADKLANDGKNPKSINDPTDPEDYITTIATAGTMQVASTTVTNQYVYAGTIQGRVWFSNNQGQKFNEITLGLPKRAVTHILVSPFNPKRIYVTLSGTGESHLWLCKDVTQLDVAKRWTNISGAKGSNPLPDAPANRVAMPMNENEQALFVGTDFGMFFSPDGGDNWSDITAPFGLPNAQINDLTFVPGTGFLQAATFGRGMWRLPIGNDTPFQIYFYLQNYVGSKGRLDTTLEFYAAGTNDPANQVFGTRIEYRKAKMSPSGWFLTTLSLSGHADIYVTVPRFLRRKIANVSTGDHPVVRTTLIIGDVNGDNVVDMKDYNLVKAKLGTLTTELVDVDGDGKVTQHDLDLITANMGLRGD